MLVKKKSHIYVNVFFLLTLINDSFSSVVIFTYYIVGELPKSSGETEIFLACHVTKSSRPDFFDDSSSRLVELLVRTAH